jgi:flagella basal body P-ring formation protein FlgA
MVKPIILALLFFVPLSISQDNEISSSSKLELIKDIQLWVSGETGLEEEAINVLALDRRLKVPSCNTKFDIGFPYKKSRQTVSVKCSNPEWSAYIGLRFLNADQVLAYARDLEPGDKVLSTDLVPIKTSVISKNAIERSADLDGMLLIRQVSKGDVALNHDFGQGMEVAVLKTDILKGASISLADVDYKTTVLQRSAKKASFPKTLLANAVAARDLSVGSVLLRSDLHIRQNVLVSLKPILRGQLISESNSKVSAFYGELTEDVLKSNQESQWMEAIRTIRSGQPIRASDLKPALMIKEGDSVILSVVSGALTITSNMLALEDGKLNQQIDLLNPESNEKVRARVTGQGRADSL